MSRRLVPALVALPALLALAGCGGAPSGSPAPSDTATPVAEPTPSDPTQLPVDLPADALIVVSATIEARNGAQMQVVEVVRKATAWDDPTAPERPAAMTQECAGALDESVYEGNLWSFAAIDVTATPSNDVAWPDDDEGVWLFPDSSYVAQAESGVLGQDTAVDPDTPNCLRMKNITQPGTGTIIAGFQGDTDAVDAAGHFTHWANHNYGYSSYSDGLVISGCSLHVLPLGSELGWPDAPGYETVIEPELCRIGNFVEDGEY